MRDGVSVIICCYNSAQRLPETLRHLLAQKFSTPVPWEVIVVVDKATKDDTWKTAESFAAAFAPGRLRVVEEGRRGLGYARICGMLAAQYEFLSYIDDDNWVCPEWVETVFRVFSEHPEIGALGGEGQAVFESGSGPAWFPPFATYYAAGRQFDAEGDITDKPPCQLWGAGLCLRRNAFAELIDLGFEFMCTEQLGPELYKLVSMRPGEDTELSCWIRALGWRFYYMPSLSYKHYLTRNRLSWTYLRRLTREAGHASAFLLILTTVTNRELSPRQLKRERSWHFQALRALLRLGSVVAQNPLGVFADIEGSVARAQADAWLGFLEAILILRGRYSELFDANRRQFIQHYMDRPPPFHPAEKSAATGADSLSVRG